MFARQLGGGWSTARDMLLTICLLGLVFYMCMSMKQPSGFLNEHCLCGLAAALLSIRFISCTAPCLPEPQHRHALAFSRTHPLRASTGLIKPAVISAEAWMKGRTRKQNARSRGLASSGATESAEEGEARRKTGEGRSEMESRDGGWGGGRGDGGYLMAFRLARKLI